MKRIYTGIILSLALAAGWSCGKTDEDLYKLNVKPEVTVVSGADIAFKAIGGNGYIEVEGLEGALEATTQSSSWCHLTVEGNKIKVEGKQIGNSELTSYLAQKPSASFLGIRRPGTQLVLYDESQVSTSSDNIINHLEYIGYYGSKVRSEVEYKRKRAYVQGRPVSGRVHPRGRNRPLRRVLPQPRLLRLRQEFLFLRGGHAVARRDGGPDHGHPGLSP